jgi:hypothetical protein
MTERVVEEGPRRQWDSILADVDNIFTITSQEDGTRFRASFGDGAPLVTDGYGGWQVVNRPKAVGIVEWQGRNPLAIEIPFMIDYWLSGIENPGIHCEGQVKSLERLCGVGMGHQPPICRVDSQGVIPYDYTLDKIKTWVVESVSWDRELELRRSDTGRRVRCGGTMTIRQFLTPQDILRQIKGTDKARVPKTYTVKHGDTLSKIANKFYSNPHKWKIIADANRIRDRRHLKVGQVLKIPPG